MVFAQVCRPPASTPDQIPLEPIFVSDGRMVLLVPSPICPSLLLPQQYRFLAVVIPHV